MIILPPIAMGKCHCQSKIRDLGNRTGAGYTWSQNSREYKLFFMVERSLAGFRWRSMYVREAATGSYWSPTPQPVKGRGSYVIRHGQGYTMFEHVRSGIKQETTVYVSMEKN
jgi:cellobiose phosphorylase